MGGSAGDESPKRLSSKERSDAKRKTATSRSRLYGSNNGKGLLKSKETGKSQADQVRTEQEKVYHVKKAKERTHTSLPNHTSVTCPPWNMLLV